VTSTRQLNAWPKTHPAKLNDAAVASALDDAAVMRGDGGIDQIAAKTPEPRKRALLLGISESAVTDSVGPGLQRACAFPPWRTLWASLRVARKPAHSGVYSCLTCTPVFNAASRASASAISGISDIGAKPSSAGARIALASVGRAVDW
jgi:hypothetical protein